jgi:predicted DNA-binding transcriptional regulator YafY
VTTFIGFVFMVMMFIVGLKLIFLAFRRGPKKNPKHHTVLTATVSSGKTTHHLDQLEDDLNNAVNFGEVVKIRYHGGSQPGSVREVVPKSVSNGKLFAICARSNAIRSFFLSKIEIIPCDSGVAIDYDPAKSPKNKAS